MTYPVVIVEAGDDYLAEVEHLTPVETLEQAIQAAGTAGYTVLGNEAGGNCETTDAWEEAAGEQHVVTVRPTT